MRKLLLMVLVAMLPLHWSSAAVAALCLPAAAAHAHGADVADAHVADAHVQGGPGSQARRVHAHDGRPCAHPVVGHGAPGASRDTADAPASSGLLDGGLLGDSGCCQQSVASVLPTRHAVRLVSTALAAVPSQTVLPDLSHLPESLFRPPRDTLA